MEPIYGREVVLEAGQHVLEQLHVGDPADFDKLQTQDGALR